MTLPRRHQTVAWWWLCWFGIILMTAGVLLAVSESMITLRGVITFMVGAIVTLAGVLLERRLNHLPQKLFRTRFGISRGVTSSFGETLILREGEIYQGYLVVDTRRACKVDRVGVRPQVGKSWSWLLPYNCKTQNIEYDKKWESPISVSSVMDDTDLVERFVGFNHDDGHLGVWGLYDPPVDVTPSRKLVYKIGIIPRSSWKGYIDFRVDSPDGIRVSHHPCRVLPSLKEDYHE